MSEENQTVQSNDNAVNNPTSEGSKTNEVPYDRFAEVNTQKNEWKAQAETANAKLAEFETKAAKAREAKMVENDEYKTLLAEKDAEISKLTDVSNQWNTYQEETRTSLMEKLPEGKREFGEGMDLTKLQKFVETEVQSVNPNAGKTNSQRQGVTPNGGDFGGYSSMAEWASKDPISYTAHTQSPNSRGIKLGYGGE
tara:strand:+ start:387 stop:974 length:588 start_codon:yes stop_codon:yes gene_type:complete